MTREILWPRIAVVSCMVACTGDMAALFAFDRNYPGYNPRLQSISTLGAIGSPIARFVSFWWILMGFIFILFAIAYAKSNGSQSQSHKITAWLIGIYAFGEEIGSGIFPGNHLAGHLTQIGIIHNIFGGIGVIAIMAAPFVIMKKYAGTNYSLFNRFLVFISLSGILAFLIFMLSHFRINAFDSLKPWHGTWQRIFVVNYYVFLIAIALMVVFENRPSRPLI